jgi:sugar lactone lactonase YvrE
MITSKPRRRSVSPRFLLTPFRFQRSLSLGATVVIALSVLSSVANAQRNYATPYFFTTLAGSSSGSSDGTGNAARFATPQGIALHSGGTGYQEVIYVADTANHTIRKITSHGVVTTFAGLAGVSGLATANGVGSQARFNLPRSVAVDGTGNVYVADTSNSAIRKITPDGLVTLLAGGTAGTQDGTGAGARFLSPNGVAVDTAGNVYVADTSNNAIRKITPTGVVTTLAGLLGTFGSQDGTGPAARFSSPRGVAVDRGGNVYVADRDNNSIRKVTPAGVVTTLAGNLSFNPGSVDGPGVDARFNGPYAVAVDSTSNGTDSIYVAEGGGHTIRKITPAGVVTTLAGLSLTIGTATDTTGNAVRFSGPQGIAVDGAGNLFVADTNNHQIRMSVFAPTITGHPRSEIVAPGDNTTFFGSAWYTNVPIAYQWYKDGVAIPGATSVSNGLRIDDTPTFRFFSTTTFLTRNNVQLADLGGYTFVATNLAGSTTSNVGTLSFATSNVGRLVNLSILTSLATGGDAFTMGYVVGGTGTTGAKPLVVRVAGPSLAQLGVTGALNDPKLELFVGPAKTGENDNWGGTAALTSAMAAVGAFAYSGPNSLDAAATVNTTSSDNSVKVSAVGTGSGTVIAELYDATPAASFFASTPRLVNVSVLKNLGSGLTVGFVVGGSTTKTVLLRAIGPTIGAAPFNVADVVADPQLTLFSGQTSVGTNDNWGGTAALTAAFNQVGAFPLPATSRDAALLATLQPGNYTVQVSGVGDTTGVAIVEVYEVP